jgi:hypothetical protein
MISGKITMRPVVAWWVNPYIAAVKLFAATFRIEPDIDKVVATILRGVRWELSCEASW